MNIEIKNSENENFTSNLAFIKALLIKKSIEEQNIEFEEKEDIYKKILEYLKNT